jgi:tetratricopeptide (TPR) repeat protein
MAHDWYSYYLLYFPRWDEAIAVQRRAVQLDPLAVIINTDLGWVLEHAGRWDEAIEHVRKTLELDPGNALLLGALGLNYAHKGMYSEALKAFQKRIDTSGRDVEVLTFIARTYAASGDTAKALQLLEEAKALAKGKSLVAPGYRTYYAYLKHFRAEELNPYGTNMKVPRDYKGWASLASGDDTKGKDLMPGGVDISELDSDQFLISMGPQHPSTHGVFRMNLRVDGETIIGLKPVMGYMHRNHEKIGERNTFLMNFPFTDRLDYLAGKKKAPKK